MELAQLQVQFQSEMYKLDIFLLLGAILAPSFAIRVLPNAIPTREVDSGSTSCPAQGIQQSTVTSIRGDLDSTITGTLVPALMCRLGQCQQNPALSCAQVLQESSGISGNYWIRRCDGQVFQVYCAMNNPCGCSGGSGAWMRIAFLNMSDSSSTCPHGQTLISNPRSCSRNVQPGACASFFSNSHQFQYSRVCGRIHGYQESSPDAFRPYNDNRGYTIDDPYVDGVSLTYGFSPRKHIWTFGAGVTDNGADTYRCPCSATTSQTWPGVLPPYIGNDYFCEAGAGTSWQRGTIYRDNPLWDGMGCLSTSSCCTLNNPPWFCKTLPAPTQDNVEVRSCGDQHQNDEDVLLSYVEIYVQ